jgi:cell division protein FtsL
MFNSRQSDVIERESYIDEFEKPVMEAKPQVNAFDQERETFNSRISSNFERLVRPDVKSVQAEIIERNRVYDKYTTAINTDAAPSQTTMQFRGMPRAEIYQDYRVDESQYQATATARPKAKLLMAVLVVIIMALSVLVVLNSALLNNMNTLINEKQQQLEVLQETKNQYDEALKGVTDSETIKDSAINNGMVE